MNSKKIIGSICILAAVILIVGAFTWNMPKSKVLIATGHPEWAPIMWQSGNKIIGVGPDLMQKICVDLKIVCDIKFTGAWDKVQEQAKNGNVDVLVAAYKTNERETYMNYSDAYTTDPISIFVKKGNNFEYSKWDDLVGKNGVLMVGDSYGQDFDNFIKNKLIATRVSTAKEAFDQLTSNQADYFIYALYSGKSAIKKENLSAQIDILPKNVAEENFYITISKKSPFAKYRQEINKLISKYKADGTITSLIESNEQLSGIGN